MSALCVIAVHDSLVLYLILTSCKFESAIVFLSVIPYLIVELIKL